MIFFQKVSLIPRGASCRRIKYIKSKNILRSRVALRERTSKQDETFKGEEQFLEKLEEYRGKRLHRVCYCKMTCWAKTKVFILYFGSTSQ